MNRHGRLIAGGILWLSSGTASAQTPSDALTQVISRNVNLRPIAGHLGGMIVQNTAPVAASEGFTWTIGGGRASDPRRDWGSMFAESPQTLGRQRLNVTLSYQHVRVDSLAGRSVDELYTATVITPLIASTGRTSLDVVLDLGVVEGTYGVTDRFDVGIALPLGRVAVTGTTVTQFVCSRPGVPPCPSGANTAQPFSASTSATGFGDVLVRAKAHLVSARAFALGAGVEVRAPTGEQADLLGTGKTQVRVSAVGASSHGSVTPHFNVGYTFGGAGPTCSPLNNVNCIQVGASEPSPEISYTFGITQHVARRLDVSADIIGRSLSNATVVDLTTGTVDGLPDTAVHVSRGRVTLAFLGLGAKVDLGKDWLLKSSVVVPLRNTSIRSAIIPMLGIGRAF